MVENQLQRTLNQPPPPPKTLRHVIARTWAVTRLRCGHREPWLKPHHVQLRQPSAVRGKKASATRLSRAERPGHQRPHSTTTPPATGDTQPQTGPQRRTRKDEGPPSRPGNTVLACAGKTSNLVAFQAWVRKEQPYRITTQQHFPPRRGQRGTGWRCEGACLPGSHQGNHPEPGRGLITAVDTRASCSTRTSTHTRTPDTIQGGPCVRGCALWISGRIYGHLKPRIRKIWVWEMGREGTSDWQRG